MSINNAPRQTVDGYEYRVIESNLAGKHPHVIYVNGEVALLNANLVCAANEGYSLNAPRLISTRFFNVYRAADGAFCIGSKAFESNAQRLETQDSTRAIFGLKVTYDETNDIVTAEAA